MQNDGEDKNNVLNPTVVKLGLVSLFADISGEMLYPITPIFLTTVLGASMTSIGLIEGVSELIASILKFYSGFWSDRIAKRKPFIVIGYFISAIAKPLVGSATSWPQVLVARGFDRTGKGLRGAPRDALLAEAVVEKKRGHAYGWHRAMDTLGAAIGPLLAVVYLNSSGEDLRTIYYFALIPGLIAVGIVLSVKEKRIQTVSAVKVRLSFSAWRQFSKNFKVYLASWGIFSLANSSDVFLLLRARQSGISLNSVIFMYCFYNLIYAGMSPYFGKLSDRIPRRNVLLFGLLVFCIVYAGFSIAESEWQYWLLFGIYGFYMAATDGAGKALAVDLVSSELKASGLGALAFVSGAAGVFASVVAGLLWDGFGAHWTFVYGVFGALCSILLLTKLKDIRTGHR